jgi:hypothetical protein
MAHPERGHAQAINLRTDRFDETAIVAQDDGRNASAYLSRGIGLEGR